MITTYQEARGEYSVTCYRVEITQDMRDRALEFAKAIILSDNQYSRLLPQHVWASGDVSLRQKLEIQRTYVGKLGELVFAKLLESRGIAVDYEDMFAIYAGQQNVDAFDFKTAAGKLVDVKTGFRSNHTRLLIPEDQFQDIPKDYYVGIKLNAVDTDASEKLVDWDSITWGDVLGYADWNYLNSYVKPRDFGESPARHIPYNKLMAINRLLREF